MSIKSFHLGKWSSWSLINEFHLDTLAVCSLLPSAELCHPGQPLLNTPCIAGSSAGTTSHHGEDGTLTTLVGSWPQCRSQSLPRISLRLLVISGAAWCSPDSSMSRTKVQRQILGKYHLGKDPFSAGGPQKCISLAFTKLKQYFYKWDWKHRLDLLAVKLLSWWNGAESLHADWLSPHSFLENSTVRAAEQILVLVLLCLEMLNRFGGSEF